MIHDPPAPRPPGRTVHDLARLARTLEAEPDHGRMLQQIAEAAVREVPGAEYAGLTVLTDDGASTPAATDDVVPKVDAVQYTEQQGPCLDAATAEAVVLVQDLLDDDRWPRFAEGAVALGVRSMLAFALFVDKGAVGALNLYAAGPNAFPADAAEIGHPLAAHASVALAASRERVNLRIALGTRDLIGQAKGILMERDGIDADQAFAILISASQRVNRKLREVADELVRTRRLPGG
jgi:GAF domain-containing protein